MKYKILLFALFALIPLFAFSQASGGQIKRNVDTNTPIINKKVLNSKKKTVKKQKCVRCGNLLELNHFTIFNNDRFICDSCIQLTKWDSPKNTKRRNLSDIDASKISEKFNPHIRQGMVVVGMPEDAVLLSRGEPAYTAKSKDGFYDWIYIRESGNWIVVFDEKNGKVLEYWMKLKR